MLRLCLIGLMTQARVSLSLLDSTGLGPLPPKIAVLGGGIGGTSAAFFLHEMFGDEALVDVYEQGKVGGRLATLPISGHQYEIGGSIIHPSNQYMVDFASKLGLREGTKCDLRMGLFDGQEFVFRDSPWTVMNVARLFWRYGLSAYKLNQLTEDLLTKFGRIYQLQAEGQAYKDVASLLHAVDPKFLEMTEVSTAEWLRGHGLGELMIEELVTAVTQCNYGQTTNMHAFVGALSIAGANPNLWSVLGGNRRVPEELLKKSRASLLTRKVTQITPTEEGRFLVTSVEEEGPNESLFMEGNPYFIQSTDTTPDQSRMQDYDMVIIAAPLTSDKSDLKLVNFTQEFSFPGHYERIACTMVQGGLQSEALNLGKDDVIDQVLVTTPKLFFNSVGRQLPVDTSTCLYDLPVWKIFSPASLKKEQLDALFPKCNSVDEIDWLAYPHYDSNQKLGKFELIPGLYHINGIEWAGSAMEMSVIGAKNTALLAYKHWMKNPDAGGNLQSKDEL